MTIPYRGLKGAKDCATPANIIDLRGVRARSEPTETQCEVATSNQSQMKNPLFYSSGQKTGPGLAVSGITVSQPR
jgi:hypothetical protein